MHRWQYEDARRRWRQIAREERIAERCRGLDRRVHEAQLHTMLDEYEALYSRRERSLVSRTT